MGQDVQLPDWAKQGPAPSFRGGPQDDHLSDGIGSSFGVIGYRGKVWTLRVNGAAHTITRADDGTPSSYIDVVILGQRKNKSKTYYPKKEDGYEDGGRPICSSLDGVTPDQWTEKQSENCALCPRAVWPTGGGSPECKDHKRLAVLLMPEHTAHILGKPWVEPVFLRVPANSLRGLKAMGDGMEAQMFNYWTYVARISFDPADLFRMLFVAKRAISDAEAPAIITLREDHMIGQILGVPRAPGLVQVPQQRPVSQVPKVNGGVPFIEHQAVEPQVPLDDITVEGGQVTAFTVTSSGPQLKATTPRPVEMRSGGAPQEASDALAERIAKLIKKPQ